LYSGAGNGAGRGGGDGILATMSEDLDGLAPTERFSSRVEHYAKYRPDYPPELLDLLKREVGFNQASVIADVGSGTGILTELLLKHGNEVFAIEPNREMREAAEKQLMHYSAFHSFEGSAEATHLLKSWVDGITCAQAFHWFDQAAAKREFYRILKPGGFIALIWNARATDATPFMADYERIVTTYGSDFARSNQELVPFERLRELFPGLTQHVLPNHQDLDWEGLRGRLLSASYMPLAGQEGHDEMLVELRQAFDLSEKGGKVRLEYETRIYLARRS